MNRNEQPISNRPGRTEKDFFTDFMDFFMNFMDLFTEVQVSIWFTVSNSWKATVANAGRRRKNRSRMQESNKLCHVLDKGEFKVSSKKMQILI